ncbi:hypothetical protein AMECASPLE_018015, partial [Ameca splendens]
MTKDCLDLFLWWNLPTAEKLDLFIVSCLITCLVPASSPCLTMFPLKPAPGQFGPEVRNPGLWVWRVEKMEAVQLDASEVGAFYNGDSYLVLENRGEQGADLHMWIGEKSSRDEQVACAMLATQLDNFLGGDPIQHRQVQGFETRQFMELFPRGVSYK